MKMNVIIIVTLLVSGCKKELAPEFASLDMPRVYVKYKQPIDEYNVSILWMPKKNSNRGYSVIDFAHTTDNRHLYIYTDKYYDPKLDKLKVNDRDTILLDYKAPLTDEVLGHNSPFFWKDVNFDGKKELIINTWETFSPNAYHPEAWHYYTAYKIAYKRDQIQAIELTDPPFSILNDGVQFDTTQQSIRYRFSRRDGYIYGWIPIYDVVYSKNLLNTWINTDYIFKGRSCSPEWSLDTLKKRIPGSWSIYSITHDIHHIEN